MARSQKIPIGLFAGGFMTVKAIWDYEKYLKTREDLTAEQKNAARVAAYTGYNPNDGTFSISSPVNYWGPLAVGYGVSKYVGGKDKNGNGLNLNARLTAIPLFKI